MKYSLNIPDRIWRERCSRIIRLIELRAPIIVIVSEALLVAEGIGKWKLIRYWLYTRFIERWKADLHHLWNRTILRKSPDQIDRELFNL